MRTQLRSTLSRSPTSSSASIAIPRRWTWLWLTLPSASCRSPSSSQWARPAGSDSVNARTPCSQGPIWPMPCTRQTASAFVDEPARALALTVAQREHGADAERLRFEAPRAERSCQLSAAAAWRSASSRRPRAGPRPRRRAGAPSFPSVAGKRAWRARWPRVRPPRPASLRQMQARPADHRQVRNFEPAEAMRARHRHAGSELPVRRAHSPLQVVAVAESAHRRCLGLERAGVAREPARELVLAHAVGVAAERKEKVAAQVMQARQVERERRARWPAARPRRARRGPRRCGR